MADQAEGLRELAKGGIFEEMGLPAVFDKGPDLEYRRLWLDHKADLLFESTHNDLDVERDHREMKTGRVRISDSAIFAQHALCRMEQAETIARFKRVTP